MAKSGSGTVVVNVVTVLVAFAFIAAGSAKLMGVEMVHQAFVNMGLPAFTGYVVGLLEVLGGIGLFLPALRQLAVRGLALIAIGAVAYHVAFPPVGEGVPALVLLVLCFTIYRMRKKQMVAA